MLTRKIESLIEEHLKSNSEKVCWLTMYLLALNKKEC